MDIGPRKFVVMTFLTGGCFFGRRHMRVVTFLAFIFLKSGMFISPVNNLFVTSLALSNRSGF